MKNKINNLKPKIKTLVHQYFSTSVKASVVYTKSKTLKYSLFSTYDFKGLRSPTPIPNLKKSFADMWRLAFCLIVLHISNRVPSFTNRPFCFLVVLLLQVNGCPF